MPASAAEAASRISCFTPPVIQYCGPVVWPLASGTRADIGDPVVSAFSWYEVNCTASEQFRPNTVAWVQELKAYLLPLSTK